MQNRNQELWERFFVAALTGAAAGVGAGTFAVSTATRIADEALSTALSRRYPPSDVDRVIEAARVVSDHATHEKRGSADVHVLPAVFVCELRARLAALDGKATS